MKIQTIKPKIGVFLLFTSLFLGCVKDKDFSTPTVNCVETEISVTNTIQQVKDMYTFGSATKIDTDVIIEGYVVSNDESGNIYKTLSIQDKPENPTSAIKISIDETNLYTTYDVGRKIYVKLKGLAVGYSFGSIQIGQAVGGELARISSFEVKNHIFRSCEVAEIIPKRVAISELNEGLLEMLIEIENVQFKTTDLGLSYANVEDTETVNRVLENFDSNCNLVDEVIVRNSGFSKFKNQLLPEGKGSVVAVFGNYYDDFQLYIRDTDDVKFTEQRCDYFNALTPTISISEVKEMYQGSMVEFGVDINYIIEGYVVSSDEYGNFKEKLVVQDATENPTSGIQLLIDKEAIFEDYNIGDKVYIKLNKLYMTKNVDVLTIGFPSGDKITKIEASEVNNFVYKSEENFEITPTEIPISEVQNPDYENTLVRILNVQLVENELGKAFAFFTGDDDGVRTLETCGETTKILVFTNGDATFAHELFPEGHGSITGILSDNLKIRTTEDVQFKEPFEVCPVIIPKIMITEVADPRNDVSARFVELYNAGDSEINLTGWKLNKYINGSTTISSSPVELNGYTIPVGGFIIIANTGYAAIFNDVPTIQSTYISGNGDDVYELVDNTGTVIDVFGVIGEDGNGTNWEYLDGRAVRNLDISEPNITFRATEWTIYSGASNNLILSPNSPQNAPNDFNPRVR
ncbi:MAG: lamin tail domain-containing protein [Lutibacter sp.]|uniref:DUF5689 domain-containing protein n=1 Tax=Lutibacter sp. TaxID=1925666 RepID=UPI0017E69428|nr:DUF5689 domain-containing protein [Lutibacter sp.]MBT8318183.1 lamin tail domain-containing protein [Lutibacter sp.]NNJ59043.1 lamin tail domain-containing protein [Lutibacter sp.]